MSLIEKIEEVRKKPDNIKLRYVWFFVIICMLLIISIWLISVKADLNNSFLKNNEATKKTNEIQKSGSELLKEIEKHKDAIKSIQPDAAIQQSND